MCVQYMFDSFGRPTSTRIWLVVEPLADYGGKKKNKIGPAETERDSHLGVHVQANLQVHAEQKIYMYCWNTNCAVSEKQNWNF